jgi:CheY-like chemotaxis protein
MSTKRKILIVEDDAESRSAIVRVLQTAGYKVAETDSAEKALGILDRQNTDVLITDLELLV